MNSVLDSHLEAFAFDYVSFGLITVVNSLWTWIAVVTAAVSFWRLRPRPRRPIEGLNVHSPPSNDVVKTSNGCSSFPRVSPPATTAEEKAPTSSGPAPAPKTPVVASTSCRFEDDGGLTKGVKFTLYFDEDNNGEDSDEDESSTAEESGGENRWESGLRMRNERKSWYRYQDLRVFNGNVVRLWDNNNHGCRVSCVW